MSSVEQHLASPTPVPPDTRAGRNIHSLVLMPMIVLLEQHNGHA